MIANRIRREEMLGVAADDLETYGAVSAQVVEQMAIGVRRANRKNYPKQGSQVIEK